MSNNNFSIVGTYDGIKYNISNFTFGTNKIDLKQFIDNDTVPPQIIIDDNKKQKLLELFKSTKPVNNKPTKDEPTKYDVEPIEPNLIVIESNENEENPLLQKLIEESKDTKGDGEHINKKKKYIIYEKDGSTIILDNTKLNKL